MSITYDPPFMTSARSVIGFSFDPEAISEEVVSQLADEGFEVKTLPESWALNSSDHHMTERRGRGGRRCREGREEKPMRRGCRGTPLTPHMMNFISYAKTQQFSGDSLSITLPFIQEGDKYRLPLENHDAFKLTQHPSPTLEEINLNDLPMHKFRRWGRHCM